MVERRTELNRRYHRKKKRAKLKARFAAAKEKGATEAGIGTNATFGSNFVGDFSVDMSMKFLEKQHELWDAVARRTVGSSVATNAFSTSTPAPVSRLSSEDFPAFV